MKLRAWEKQERKRLLFFNYVGRVDIAYTEDELAEIKEQEEQEEKK